MTQSQMFSPPGVVTVNSMFALCWLCAGEGDETGDQAMEDVCGVAAADCADCSQSQ